MECQRLAVGPRRRMLWCSASSSVLLMQPTSNSISLIFSRIPIVPLTLPQGSYKLSDVNVLVAVIEPTLGTQAPF